MADKDLYKHKASTEARSDLEMTMIWQESQACHCAENRNLELEDINPSIGGCDSGGDHYRRD
jgi:hypothetical protein